MHLRRTRLSAAQRLLLCGHRSEDVNGARSISSPRPQSLESPQYPLSHTHTHSTSHQALICAGVFDAHIMELLSNTRFRESSTCFWGVFQSLSPQHPCCNYCCARRRARAQSAVVSRCEFARLAHILDYRATPAKAGPLCDKHNISMGCLYQCTWRELPSLIPPRVSYAVISSPLTVSPTPSCCGSLLTAGLPASDAHSAPLTRPKRPARDPDRATLASHFLATPDKPHIGILPRPWRSQRKGLVCSRQRRQCITPALRVARPPTSRHKNAPTGRYIGCSCVCVEPASCS